MVCHVEKVVLMLSEALCPAANIFPDRNYETCKGPESSVQVTVSPLHLTEIHNADVFPLSSVTVYLSVSQIGKGV